MTVTHTSTITLTHTLSPAPLQDTLMDLLLPEVPRKGSVRPADVPKLEIKRDAKGLVSVLGATTQAATSAEQLMSAIEQVGTVVAVRHRQGAGSVRSGLCASSPGSVASRHVSTPGMPRCTWGVGPAWVVGTVGVLTPGTPGCTRCAYMFPQGLAKRHIGSTAMNHESSRSHLIISCMVEGVNLQSQAVTRGKISFVDLAGSER